MTSVLNWKVCFVALCAAACGQSFAGAASISVKYQIEDERVKELVKTQYRICATEKKQYLSLQDDGSTHATHTYAMVKKNIEKSRPGYSLDVPLSPEPVWAQLDQGLVKEYFDEDRHARYVTFVDYRIAMDGSCSLQVQKRNMAYVHNGDAFYLLNLDKKQVQKFRSRQALGQAALTQGNLPKAVACHMIEYLLTDPSAQPSPGAGLGCQLPSKVYQDPIEKSGTEHIAGELCDNYQLGESAAVDVCLWSPLNYYSAKSSRIKRPVILRVSHVTPTGLSYRQEAVEFKQASAIPASLFQVPKDYVIVD